MRFFILANWNGAGNFGTPWRLQQQPWQPPHQNSFGGTRNVRLPKNPNSFPKGNGKRPANWGVGGSKTAKKPKIIKYDSVNDQNSAVLELRVGEGSEPNISITMDKFSMKKEPAFFSTPGIKRTALALPLLMGTVPESFQSVSKIPLTCSFLGLTCHSCNFRGGRHALNGRGLKECRRVFLIGDAFVPPLVGGENDCFAVIRIRGGSLSQAQAVLEAQNDNGLAISPGSFIVVCLLTHLCRVGNAAFWTDFDKFDEWCKIKFKAVVLPTIPTFPKGFESHHLVTCEQFLKTLQGRYMGDMRGGTVGAYSLWRPFHLSMSNFEGERVALAVPPVIVKGNVILGGNSVWAGLEGDFSGGCPTPYVKFFFTKIIEEIKNLDGGSPLPLVIPNAQSLDRGLGEGVANPHPTVGDPEGNKLFLLGAYILRDVDVALSPLVARFGIDTINLCKGGKVMDKLDFLDLPRSEKPKDVLILHLFGNYVFECYYVALENGNYHMTCPQFLSDFDIDHLIRKTHAFISKILENFKGIVKLVGPFPRYISPCCAISHHQIQDPIYDFSNLQYILYLSRFLEIHPLLRFPNLEFISFPSLLPKPLKESHFPDGVHLDPIANKHLANRLSQLVSKKVKCPPALTDDSVKFTVWLAGLKNTPLKTAVSLPSAPPMVTVTPSSPQPVNMDVVLDKVEATDISMDLQLLQMDDDLLDYEP